MTLIQQATNQANFKALLLIGIYFVVFGFIYYFTKKIKKTLLFGNMLVLGSFIATHMFNVSLTSIGAPEDVLVYVLPGNVYISYYIFWFIFFYLLLKNRKSLLLKAAIIYTLLLIGLYSWFSEELGIIFLHSLLFFFCSLAIFKPHVIYSKGNIQLIQKISFNWINLFILTFISLFVSCLFVYRQREFTFDRYLYKLSEREALFQDFEKKFGEADNSQANFYHYFPDSTTYFYCPRPHIPVYNKSCFGFRVTVNENNQIINKIGRGAFFGGAIGAGGLDYMAWYTNIWLLNIPPTIHAEVLPRK